MSISRVENKWNDGEWVVSINKRNKMKNILSEGKVFGYSTKNNEELFKMEIVFLRRLN